MSEKVYGICENKCLKEVYSKEEIDDMNVVIKEDLAVLSGNLTISSSTTGTTSLDYPTGFSYESCVPVACGLKVLDNKGYNYEGYYTSSDDLLQNAYKRRLNLNSSKIKLDVDNPTDSDKTVTYKIVLLKV